jgi:hypothetical protein
VIFVSELGRSVDFYRDLFACEVAIHEPDAALLLAPGGFQIYSPLHLRTLPHVGNVHARGWPTSRLPWWASERHNGHKHEPIDTSRSHRVESLPLTSSTKVTRPSQLLLPRLRSRGGWGAGSTDKSGRRNPRAASNRDDRAFPQVISPSTRNDLSHARRSRSSRRREPSGWCTRASESTR